MADLKSFHENIKKGNVDAVRSALASDPGLLDAPNESGQTAFLLSKYYRQPEIAEYLLSQNPKLDIFTGCVAGRTAAVLEELDHDPTLLESRNSDGWTPLHLAAFFGHPELARALLDRGAIVEAQSTNAMRNTPLHAAVAGGHPALVALLLESGADANARQHGGWTALHGAAQSGNRIMVEALLAHGARADANAENGQKPFDLALSKGHAELAALLEELGRGPSEL